MLAKMQRPEDARKMLRGVSTSSADERVQLLLAEAQVLRETRRYEEAFKLLTQALEKSPDNVALLYDTAMTAEKLGRIDAMERQLRRVIELRPDYAHAYNALGYTFADRSVRLPEALQLIEKAHQLAPDDAFILDSMGWVYYRMGDLAKRPQVSRARLRFAAGRRGRHSSRRGALEPGRPDACARAAARGEGQGTQQRIAEVDDRATAYRLVMPPLRAWVAMLVIALGACATTPPSAPERSYAGRFSAMAVSGERRDSVSGRFLIEIRGQQQLIELATPVGTTLARIEIEPGRATVTDGKLLGVSGPNADELVEQALGWRLPVAGLSHWLEGPPRPGP